MKSAATLLLLLAFSAPAHAESFLSPTGLYRVDFVSGTNAPGTSIKPMTADIVPVNGGPATHVVFQLNRYSDPTAQTVKEAFHFSKDESAVAVENRLTESKFGLRVIPLKTGLSWKTRNVEAVDPNWVDEDRLVFEGDAGNDGHYIGVFDARTGRTRVAHANLSAFVDYDITEVTPVAVHFRERTQYTGEQRCYAFNTATGVRTPQRCPR